MTPAKRISRSLARSAIYHKKTGLMAAGVGVVACVLVVVFDEVWPKGAATVVAMGAAYVAFRALRHAQRYMSLDGSPVLEAISQDPSALVRVEWRRGSEGDEVVVATERAELVLRPDPPSAEGAAALTEAFAAHAPEVEVVRPSGEVTADRE